MKGPSGHEIDAAAPFSTRVDPALVPDYGEIITEPMDLGTIKARLEGTEAPAYENHEDVSRDVQLVFSNCMLYNR